MLSAPEVLAQHAKLADQLRNDSGYLKYLDAFMYDTWEKAHKRNGWAGVRESFGSMYHPAGNPAQFRALLHKDLFDARTYQVTEKMVDAVTGTMENSRKSVLAVEEAGLPSPTGFVWLDKPVRMPDRNGREVVRRVISWGPQSITYEYANPTPGGWPAGKTRKTRVEPGVRITSWTYAKDRDFYWTDEAVAARAPQLSHLDLVFTHSNVIPFGTRVRLSGENDSPEYREDFIVWVRTLWAFMDTEIVTTAKAAVSRPFLRRAQRSLGRPDVNVVSLRHVVVSRDLDREGARREVDWSCAWVVSGHHRHLAAYDPETYQKHHAVPDPAMGNETCAVCGERVTWVHAYVKDPSGKPLRSVEQLYRLER